MTGYNNPTFQTLSFGTIDFGNGNVSTSLKEAMISI